MINLTDETNLQCSSCGTNVDSENINQTIGVAKCSHCNSVFRFSTNNEELQDDVSNKQTENFLNTLFESQQFIHLSLLVFMFFWNISFVIFVFTCLSKGYTALAVALGIITVVGLYLTYFLVAALFGSKQTWSLSGFANNIDNIFPLFGGQRQTLDNFNIRGVYAQKHQFVGQKKQKTNSTYQVKGIHRNGQKVELLKGLRYQEKATEIEGEIRKLLRH